MAEHMKNKHKNILKRYVDVSSTLDLVKRTALSTVTRRKVEKD
jgi:hypothetical protein